MAGVRGFIELVEGPCPLKKQNLKQCAETCVGLAKFQDDKKKNERCSLPPSLSPSLSLPLFYLPSSLPLASLPPCPSLSPSLPPCPPGTAPDLVESHQTNIKAADPKTTDETLRAHHVSRFRLNVYAELRTHSVARGRIRVQGLGYNVYAELRTHPVARGRIV